jgi:hypothetical protein
MKNYTLFHPAVPPLRIYLIVLHIKNSIWDRLSLWYYMQKNTKDYAGETAIYMQKTETRP